METTLIYTGIACMIAAIIGGGLKAFQIEMPVFSSIKRQFILGIFGAVLTVVGFKLQIPNPTNDKTKVDNNVSSLINDFKDHNIKFKEYLDEKISLIQDLKGVLNQENNFNKFLSLIDTFNANFDLSSLEYKKFEDINSEDFELFKNENLSGSFQQQKNKLDALNQKRFEAELEGREIIKKLRKAGSQNDKELYRKYSIEWANNLLSFHNLMNQILNVQLGILNSTRI